MPYIIITRKYDPNAPVCAMIATAPPHAVDTIEDARHTAFVAIDRASKLDREMNSDEQRADRALRLAVRFDIDDGGTIGPLPDGTIIEVRPIGWDQIRDTIGQPNMIAMYNEMSA